MIRVFVVDDHPALQAGLNAVLRAEPGLVPVGSAASAEEALEGIDRERPDVVLVDYQLQGGDGMQVCHRARLREWAPRTILYSGYASEGLALPALVAGAHGVVSKNAPAEDLFEAIRQVARGGALLPPASRRILEESVERLDPESELPVFGMLVEGTRLDEVAEVLGIDRSELLARAESILGKLRVQG
jgi:DNA-binding NarL/FixJ family response regulator